MKKSILSIVMLLVVATATNAAPRFGIIGEQENGLGAFITDDMYNAQVSFSNSTNDATAKTEGTKITVGANYKIALDSVTALTAGVNYKPLLLEKSIVLILKLTPQLLCLQVLKEHYLLTLY